ncbi:hypothetical protein ACX9MO_04440 [Pseudooceanicola sp. 502str34]
MQAETPETASTSRDSRAPSASLYWTLFAIWGLAFVGSFLVPHLIPAGPGMLVSGIGRAFWLAGLQCLASLLALVILVRARDFAPGSLPRRVAWGPAGLALLVVCAMLLMTVTGA